MRVPQSNARCDSDGELWLSESACIYLLDSEGIVSCNAVIIARNVSIGELSLVELVLVLVADVLEDSNCVSNGYIAVEVDVAVLCYLVCGLSCCSGCGCGSSCCGGSCGSGSGCGGGCGRSSLDASFWSSTDYSKQKAGFMYMETQYSGAFWNYTFKDYSLSVRCLKDWF